MDWKEVLKELLSKMINLMLLSCCKNNSCVSECCVNSKSEISLMTPPPSPEIKRRNSI